MLTTFKSVSPYFRLKTTSIVIDNIAFKLHYRWTFLLLIVVTVLVTSREYIGEHIRCITNAGVSEKIMNNFCFFTTTFTMIRLYNDSLLETGAAIHPGVGPLKYAEDPIKRHAYYQWVPFVLFGQALMFYVTHFLWKRYEGGQIRSLVNGLHMIKISRYLEESNLKIGEKLFPSKNLMENRLSSIKMAFINRLEINKFWGLMMFFCEILNFLNVLLQIYITNLFLAGQFYDLGIKVAKEDWGKNVDALDVVFPKMTKCHFYKYGSGGSIQLHDALCVMALNIINEKIYTFLWFWYAFLAIASIIAIIWRIALFCCYRRFPGVGIGLVSRLRPSKFSKNDLYAIISRCTFSNFLFLYYLASNMDNFLFREFLAMVSREMKPYSLNDSEVDENDTNHLTEDDDEIKRMN